MRHLKHHGMHLLMCLPMVVLAALAIASGSSVVLLLPVVGCVLMMMAMMGGMGGGGRSGGGGTGRRRISVDESRSAAPAPTREPRGPWADSGTGTAQGKRFVAGAGIRRPLGHGDG
jgi:hypothetical protein